jgi:N-acetylglucosamine-6-phosphate deacetylase
MAAMGLGPGTYSLAEQQVIVDSTSARLEDGTLAGSILTLDQACRNYARQTNCSFAEAVNGATMVAAGALRMERGLWVEDAPADVVLMDETGHVKATFVSGVCVFEASRQ